MEQATTTIPQPAAAVDAPVESTGPIAKGDKHIWGIYISLVLISIIELYSASSREVAGAGMGVFGTIIRHGAMLLAGLGIILYLQRTNYHRFPRWILGFTFISILAMLFTMFCGERINGARRSIQIVFMSVQPSEFLKLSAAMVLALIMSRTQVKGGGLTKTGVYTSATIILIICAMLAPQGLTNTLLLMSISMSMMIIGGITMKRLAAVLLIYVACFGLYLGVQAVRSELNSAKTEQSESRVGVWWQRISNFSGTGKPKYEEPMTPDNRQEMLGYMAQAHGGVIGVMPGNSRETARLPLAFTDYIYSIIVEEMGLVGGIVVLVLYLWLLARASAIASRCSRAFPAFLVIGMALVIVFQALFHICIVTGVIPVSGQPLPLISKGGSSILVTSIAFGVMLSVSRFAVRTGAKKKEINEEINALPEDLRADNPSQL